MKRWVVVTRPAEGAADTVARLRALGFEPVFAPLLAIVPRDGPVAIPTPVGAVAMTSRNSVPALPPQLRGVPVFAVGDATAAAARAAGCMDVRSAAGNACDLARAMLGAVHGNVLLLAGSGQGLPLAAALRAGGVAVIRRVAYRTRRVGRLPASVQDLIAAGGAHGIVFMSAATSDQFVRALPERLAPALAATVAACISETAATSLRHLPWRRLRVSLKPNLPDTLALL